MTYSPNKQHCLVKSAQFPLHNELSHKHLGQHQNQVVYRQHEHLQCPKDYHKLFPMFRYSRPLLVLRCESRQQVVQLKLKMKSSVVTLLCSERRIQAVMSDLKYRSILNINIPSPGQTPQIVYHRI